MELNLNTVSRPSFYKPLEHILEFTEEGKDVLFPSTPQLKPNRKGVGPVMKEGNLGEPQLIPEPLPDN